MRLGAVFVALMWSGPAQAPAGSPTRLFPWWLIAVVAVVAVVSLRLHREMSKTRAEGSNGRWALANTALLCVLGAVVAGWWAERRALSTTGGDRPAADFAARPSVPDSLQRSPAPPNVAPVADRTRTDSGSSVLPGRNAAGLVEPRPATTDTTVLSNAAASSTRDTSADTSNAAADEQRRDILLFIKVIAGGLGIIAVVCLVLFLSEAQHRDVGIETHWGGLGGGAGGWRLSPALLYLIFALALCSMLTVIAVRAISLADAGTTGERVTPSPSP